MAQRSLTDILIFLQKWYVLIKENLEKSKTKTIILKFHNPWPICL